MVESKYTPQSSEYKVWLFGDSILDNSYWNGVEQDMTGVLLKSMLPNVTIKDRSTEELASISMLACLEQNKRYQVGSNYVKHRNELGIPYDEAQDGNVQLDPQFGPKDFVFLSVGGNDFALFNVMDPAVILARVEKIMTFYADRGVQKDRMFYMTPYPPSEGMVMMVASIGQDLNAIYKQCIEQSKSMCTKLGIGCITLDHFTDVQRLAG